jgi:hypothetical protein
MCGVCKMHMQTVRMQLNFFLLKYLCRDLTNNSTPSHRFLSFNLYLSFFEEFKIYIDTLS